MLDKSIKFWLKTDQHAVLQIMAGRRGCSMSKLLRRAVDAFTEIQKNEWRNQAAKPAEPAKAFTWEELKAERKEFREQTKLDKFNDVYDSVLQEMKL